MCDCVETTNKLLEQHNAILITTLFGPPRVAVEIQKLDPKKRGRLPTMMASFCPFCGERYKKEAVDG